MATRKLQGRDGNTADVGSRGGLYVSSVLPLPSERTASELQQEKLFASDFTDGGGSSDMAVDGSSTNVLFNIEATTTEIIYISCVRLFIEDAQSDITTNEIRRWCSVAASPGLTNGLKLSVDQDGTTTEIFGSDGVKSIGDVVKYIGGHGVPMTNAYFSVRDGVSAGVDILNFELCFARPIVLYPGTQDRIYFTVRDDLTAMDTFTCRGSGWQETI